MEGHSIDILLCRAGGRLCALRLGNVVETMRLLPITPVEGGALQPYISGLSLIRGQACPVLDLSRLLGNSDAPATRLVLLRVDAEPKERRVALAVSSVEGVSRASSDALSSLPPLLEGAVEGAVEAIAELDGQLMLLLQAGALIDEHAWATLEAS